MISEKNFTRKGLGQLIELEQEQIARKKREVLALISDIELLGTEIKGHEANISRYRRELEGRRIQV